MKKLVWKLAPYECFEVDAIAGWLDELSLKGLQFRSKFGPVCIFERSPSPARYRVDPGREQLDPAEDERMATYRDFGWEFCSCYTRYADVYRTEDPNAVELHTDRDLLNDLVKRAIRDRLGRLLVFAFPAVRFIQFTADAFTDWVTHSYDTDYLSLLLISVLALLIILLTIVLTVAAALRYKNHPETMVHTPKRAKQGAFWRGMMTVLLILCIAGFIWAWAVAFSSNSHTYYWEV